MRGSGVEEWGDEGVESGGEGGERGEEGCIGEDLAVGC